jgi:hypothetical protein
MKHCEVCKKAITESNKQLTYRGLIRKQCKECYNIMNQTKAILQREIRKLKMGLKDK